MKFAILPAMDIVLFGIQGSGKGTQAKLLAAELCYEIFEAGGALRAIAASGSELGSTVKSFIDKGHLVPHEIIMQVVSEAVAAVPAGTKLLFDGIPRDSDQQRDFDLLMDRLGRSFHCIHLLFPLEDAIERIKGRALAEGRKDDASEEFIRRRMELFQAKTMPVIEEYKRRGLVTEVDAKGTVEEVYGRMKESLMEQL